MGCRAVAKRGLAWVSAGDLRMIQLSYVSSAARPMTAADLLAILQQCYGHNALHDITGLLLYGNGTFLQALEGDEAVVAPLYERIMRDPRHARVTCLARQTIATRHFPGWSISFRRLSDEFDPGDVAGDGARETLLRLFAGAMAPATWREAEPQVAELREAPAPRPGRPRDRPPRPRGHRRGPRHGTVRRHPGQAVPLRARADQRGLTGGE